MTSRGSSMKSLLREPLLHFTLVAALLVGAHRVYTEHARPEVEVTGEWLDSLARDFELRTGRPPDAAERTELAHAWLEDEILCREAIKAGHTDDPRVRGLLAATLREVLEPVIPDPSDAELEAFRASYPEPFRYPAGVSFEHASFAKAEDIPAGTLENLRGGHRPPAANLLRLPNPMPMTWLPQIEKTFGAEFVAAVMTARPDEWTGPLNSSRGVHFIRIVRRDEPREMPMEEVRPALVAKWLEARRKAAVSAKVAEMRASYRIELPPGIPAP